MEKQNGQWHGNENICLLKVGERYFIEVMAFIAVKDNLTIFARRSLLPNYVGKLPNYFGNENPFVSLISRKIISAGSSLRQF